MMLTELGLPGVNQHMLYMNFDSVSRVDAVQFNEQFVSSRTQLQPLSSQCRRFKVTVTRIKMNKGLLLVQDFLSKRNQTRTGLVINEFHALLCVLDPTY